MATNKKNYEGKIPFVWNDEFVYSNGEVREAYREQLSYESYRVEDWKDNCLFYSTLEFVSMSRGRSAANFEAVLRNVDGDTYPDGFLEGCHVNIFMIDMLEIVQKTDISHGMVGRCMWTFCKRGGSYGLRLVENAS